MQFIVRAVVGFCFILAFCPLFVGCGDGSRRTTYVTNINESPAAPYAPTPHNPVCNKPPFRSPCDPTTATVAPIATPVFLFNELINTLPDAMDTSTPVYVGIFKIFGINDATAVRKITLHADHDLPKIEGSVNNDQTGESRTTVVGQFGRDFELVSDRSLELGYIPNQGGSLSVYLLSDTRGLDGQQVTFTLDVEVSVANGPAQTFTGVMTYSLAFKEYPRLALTAVTPNRVSLKGQDTILAEVDVRNDSLTHSSFVTSVVIEKKDLAGATNLRLDIPNNSGFALAGFDFGWGVRFDIPTAYQMAVPPRGHQTYSVIADTTNATGPVILTANSVGQRVDNGVEFGGIGGPVGNDGQYVMFTTTLVNPDLTTVVSQLQLDRTIGPVDGTFAVMRLKVSNPTNAPITLASITCQVVSSDPTNTLGTAWLAVDDGIDHITVSRNQTYGTSRFTLAVDSAVTVTVPANGSIIIEVFATAPLLGTNDTMQMTVQEVLSSQGLLIVPANAPRGAPTILIG